MATGGSYYMEWCDKKAQLETPKNWHDRFGLDLRQKCVETSLAVGEAVRAVYRRCWTNARRAVLTLPDYAQSIYVEGMSVTVDQTQAFEHGWVVHNGVIIDPTLAREHIYYFPSVELNKGEVQELLNQFPQHEREPFYHFELFKSKFSVAHANAQHFRDSIWVRIDHEILTQQYNDNEFYETIRPTLREND